MTTRRLKPVPIIRVREGSRTTAAHMINTMDSEVCTLHNYSGTRYIYMPELTALFEYSDLLFELVHRLDDSDAEKACRELGGHYSEELVRGQLELLRQWAAKMDRKRRKQAAHYGKVSLEAWEGGKVLDSLWMNISHDCNLRCVYCYGSGGAYGGRRKLMTVESAKRIIDYWYARADKEAEEYRIVFFGGEPLMNKRVLMFSVSYINSVLGDRANVSYAMTTNGTILDEELLRLFADNDFRITISLDGDKEIQDRSRPFASGKGSSFDRIGESVARLGGSGLPITARLTLVHEHVPKLAETVHSLWDLGISNVNFDLVSSPDDRFKVTAEDLELLKPQLERLAREVYGNFVHRRKRYVGTLTKYAKAMHNHQYNSCVFYAKNSLMVGPDGEIYKCHRLIEDPKFHYGNIHTDIDWDRYDNAKPKPPACSECWARHLCVGCSQVNWMYHSDLNTPYDISCEFTRMVIWENLKLYATLHEKEPQLFKLAYRMG